MGSLGIAIRLEAVEVAAKSGGPVSILLEACLIMRDACQTMIGEETLLQMERAKTSTFDVVDVDRTMVVATTRDRASPLLVRQSERVSSALPGCGADGLPQSDQEGIYAV